MKAIWLTILLMFALCVGVSAQTYWNELSDSARESLSHSGKASVLARSLFQDPSIQLTDSTQANDLLIEIGSSGERLLPFYWQLFAQVSWPKNVDSTIAASHLVNLLERNPNFVIGYYAQGYDTRTLQRYTAYLAHGYSSTPWLYPNTKDLKKRLRHQVEKPNRKAVKSFIQQLEAAF